MAGFQEPDVRQQQAGHAPAAPPAAYPASPTPPVAVAYSTSPAPPYAGPPSYPNPYGAPPAPSSQQLVAQLLQILLRPEVRQALIQILLGSAGSPTVTVPSAQASPIATSLIGTVGGFGNVWNQSLGTPNNQIPVSAFMNLLGLLATQASEAYNAERAIGPSAAPFNYDNSPLVDLASPDARARALLETLQASGDGGASRAQRQKRLKALADALYRV